MALYREEQIAGNSYVRASAIQIDNPMDGDKRITIYEQRVMTVGDQTIIHNGIDSLHELFNAETASKEFQLMNAETGEAIDGATMTYAELYSVLYSLYIHMAKERDVRIGNKPIGSSGAPTPEEQAAAQAANTAV